MGCGEVGLGGCASWRGPAETLKTGQRRLNYETLVGRNRWTAAINLLLIPQLDPSADGA